MAIARRVLAMAAPMTRCSSIRRQQPEPFNAELVSVAVAASRRDLRQHHALQAALDALAACDVSPRALLVRGRLGCVQA